MCGDQTRFGVFFVRNCCFIQSPSFSSHSLEIVVLVEINIAEVLIQFLHLKVESVAKNSANAAEAQNELRALLGFVRHNLEGPSEALVAVS